MIEFAKKSFPKAQYGNLNFQLLAAEEIDFDNEFDCVVSFTALQWVKDHPLIVKNAKKSLRTEGTFAITAPMGLPKELELALQEVLSDKRWDAYFDNFETGWNFPQESNYRELLLSEGFKVNRIQVVKQEDVFPSLAIFRSFISQWFPYLRPLPVHLKEEFMDSILSRYIELEPLDEQGMLHFKINRLEVVAKKK